MIKSSATLGNYTLVFSGDPSLDLPTFTPCGSCSSTPCADCAPKADEVSKERERMLTLARETGNWEPIVKEGEVPTVFHFRPLTGTAYQWWAGQTSRNQLIGVESASLALRLGITDVKNFGKHEVKRFRNDDGQELANTKIIDAIYAEAGATVGVDIVVELGTIVVDRARAGISPLSSRG